METINEETAEDLLNFISPRETVPIEAETVIVSKTKEWYKKKLLGKLIKSENLPELRKELEHTHFKCLMQPGETVGIIAGQCIGERTTQGSLNNFHSAGLDTGSASQIDNLQNIINASKIKKRDIRKYVKTSLFLNSKPSTVESLRNKIRGRFAPVTFSTLLVKTEYENVTLPEKFSKVWQPQTEICRMRLSLQKIFSDRITRTQLIDAASKAGYDSFCVPYSSLEEEATEVDFYCSFGEGRRDFFLFLKTIRPVLICGIKGVGDFVFCKSPEAEWYIECMSDGIEIFFQHQDLYDMSKILCNSVHDMCQHFGVLVAQQVIVNKCKEILTEVDDVHFKILSTKMTKNGTVDPLTRYTMRGNSSPLSKASFEESFETFLKACKYKEKETFKSISSSVICGKKPRIGTYNIAILVDPSFYVK